MRVFSNRWSALWLAAKISLVTLGSLAGPTLVAPTVVLALTEEEIVRKLEPIPIFLILNSEGVPLSASASASEDEDLKIPTVFVDLETAQAYLAQAQASDASAEINITSLGSLYAQLNADGNAPPPLLYFPSDDVRQQAVAINPDYQGGVPVFYAVRQERLTNAAGETVVVSNLIRIRDENGELQWPVFFSPADLQVMIDRFTEQNPEQASQVVVEVLPLAGLIAAMGDNADTALQEQLGQLRLFPSSEVIGAIQSQAGQPAGN